jgi:hypothetical protein
MPSGEGLRQLVPGRLAGRMLTASEGRHGRLRPDAMLGALELVVAHVVLDRCGCQGPGRSRRGGSSPVSSSSIAQQMAAIWSGKNGRVGDHLAADDPQATDKRAGRAGARTAARRAGLEFVEKLLTTTLTSTDTTERNAGMLRLRTVVLPHRPGYGPGSSSPWWLSRVVISRCPLSLQLERVRSGVCAGAGRSSWHRRSSRRPPAGRLR